MTLSLAAVFIPVLFLGGIVGRLLHEFAVTIAVGDSGLGLRLDQPHADAVQPLPRPPHAHGTSSTTPSKGVRRVAPALRHHARGTLRFRAGDDGDFDRAARRDRCYLFSIVPKGFLPSEDQGRFNVNTEGAQGISFR